MSKIDKKLDKINELINKSNKVLIIQAENPDGDSLGSALALEQILGDMDKEPTLYCPVQMPRYLHYMEGWSRVEDTFNNDFDMAIIVDTSSAALLERVFSQANISALSSKPLVVLDHHDVAEDLPVEALVVSDHSYVATGELIHSLAKKYEWPLNTAANESLAYSILSDSLGLMSSATTAKSIHTIGEIVESGVKLNELDERRREYSKKSEDIFRYKGQLFERAEFLLEGALGLVVIPWEEIQKYSDAYNPSMLIIDELRMVNGVQLAAVFKMYPDGKITCKMRANSGGVEANRIAEKFGGGGHAYAAGFKIRDKEFSELKKEFISVVSDSLENADAD